MKTELAAQFLPHLNDFSLHLKINETTKLDDNSILKDILNISGDEKFTQSENNLKWETKGENIVYKGTTTKALPITTKITYYLDGKEIELNKLEFYTCLTQLNVKAEEI